LGNITEEVMEQTFEQWIKIFLVDMNEFNISWLSRKVKIPPSS